jgi:hypothetical protein
VENSTTGVTTVGLGNTTKSTTHLGRGEAITEVENITVLTTRQVREITTENTTDSSRLRRKPDNIYNCDLSNC